MKRDATLRWLPALLIALVWMSILPGTGRAEPAPGYVTVLFGRMQFVSVGSDCVRLPNTIDLATVKADLDARGIEATGIVVTTTTAETGYLCSPGLATHVGWDTIAAWHADGWSFVSGGTHANVTWMSYEAQVRETCGSLATFDRRGIDASGMYAYGNNKYTTQTQVDPVSRCFEFGRRYASGLNVRATTGPPWFANVLSVNGGQCNDPTLPCYTERYTSPMRYTSPPMLAASVAAAPDTWFALQFYRIVDGASSNGIYHWDCTSPDWRRHFTSHTELYCYADFLQVMDALRAAMDQGVVVADPETVANAWGRFAGSVPPPDTTPPTVSIATPANGGTVVRRTWQTITANASDAVGVARVTTRVNGATVCNDTAAPYACRWWVPATQRTWHRIEVTARDAAGNAATASVTVRAVWQAA